MLANTGAHVRGEAFARSNDLMRAKLVKPYNIPGHEGLYLGAIRLNEFNPAISVDFTESEPVGLVAARFLVTKAESLHRTVNQIQQAGEGASSFTMYDSALYLGALVIDEGIDTFDESLRELLPVDENFRVVFNRAKLEVPQFTDNALNAVSLRASQI